MLKQRRKRSFPHHLLKPHLRKKMKVSQKSRLGKQEDFKTTVLEGMETAKHQTKLWILTSRKKVKNL